MSEEEVKERANLWVHGPIDETSRVQIQGWIDRDPKALSDAFYTTLSFGTGGMRGVMGVGSSRINIYTVQMATQGLANYILAKSSDIPSPSVFISYDSRNNSREYAITSARVLAGNGIRALVTAELRPTPLVSFGLRARSCIAGIMITASHNPKEYNGYKVFWSDGAQVLSPHDKRIVEEVARVTDLAMVEIAPESSSLIEVVGGEIDLEYLDAISLYELEPKEDHTVGDRLKITYTPLHGTGAKLIPKALQSWGFSNINLVDSQLIPNGDFPTVKSPNPESKEALALGINQLQDTLSDLLIATDPDADRIGVVALYRDKPFVFNGNQVAAICLEFICHILEEQKRLPSNGATVSTIVSTDLLSKIAEQYGVKYFSVLTGFKYIGELIHQWEQEGNPYEFLFGAEESYGYLMGTHCRDKDAVISSCLIAEIALRLKIEGRTLVDYLKEIYQKYGLFYETQRTINFAPGVEGMKKISSMMQTLREKPLQELLSEKITSIEDYQTGQKTLRPSGQTELLALPKSNVLLYRTDTGTKIVVRPSGTEPKLKIYAGICLPCPTDIFDGLSKSEEKVKTLLDQVEKVLS